jgi:hypothetical protein
MLAALAERDRQTFAAIARKRDVSAVVVSSSAECGAASAMFPLTWRFGDTCISTFDQR